MKQQKKTNKQNEFDTYIYIYIYTHTSIYLSMAAWAGAPRGDPASPAAGGRAERHSGAGDNEILSLSLLLLLVVVVVVIREREIRTCMLHTRTYLPTHLLSIHVTQTRLGMGMGMNGTAQYRPTTRRSACRR